MMRTILVLVAAAFAPLHTLGFLHVVSHRAGRALSSLGSSVTTRSSLQSPSLVLANNARRNDEELDSPIYSRDLNDKVAREFDAEYQIVDKASYPWWKRLFRRGVRRAKQPGRLILLRNGESTWNLNGTFIGWADPDLSQEGVEECEYAARLLVAEGYEPDLVYTSRLRRGIQSALIVLEQTQSLFLPLYKSWRLNERSYGALTGLSKKETAQKFGTAVVQAWRNSLKARPPPLTKDDVHYPGNDPRYADLSQDRIPMSESLRECLLRTRPLWDTIRKDLARGDTVLVVGHSNSLRGLIQVIDEVDDDSILQVNVPPGIPLVYKFDSNLKPIPPQRNKPTQMYTSASFLERPEKIQAALQKHKEWKATVPGLESDMAGGNNKQNAVASRIRRKETLEDSLSILKRETGLLEPDVIRSLIPQERWEDDPCEFEESQFFGQGGNMEEENKRIMVNIEPLPKAAVDPVLDPVVVFIRHGRTPHNNLALFTGWEDPPLAKEGVEDAKRAGQILRRHGYQFDVVYTSWLTRAIQTAYYVLDEMDCVWVPMVKSWRLNERMYGALTGKSKAMIANQYGEDQLKRWRRGFKIQPPPVSSYSPSYPGNDYKRTKYVKDLRISWSETLNRSLERRKLEIHRKFPKTESLHDCMKRSIPFYTRRIVTEAVSKGKRVLITGHENSIRGILMHLCGIPEAAMSQLHIPNGMPLVYSVKGKCIKVLDDGSGRDPMDIHDFGPAAQYLFKPCELDDDFYEKMATKADSSKPAQKVKSTAISTIGSMSKNQAPADKASAQSKKDQSVKGTEGLTTKVQEPKGDKSVKEAPAAKVETAKVWEPKEHKSVKEEPAAKVKTTKVQEPKEDKSVTEAPVAKVETTKVQEPNEDKSVKEEPVAKVETTKVQEPKEHKSVKDEPAAKVETSKVQEPKENKSVKEEPAAQVEITQTVGDKPTEIEQPAGSLPTDIEQPAGSLPTEIEQPAGSSPTEIEQPAGSSHTEIEQPARKTARDTADNDQLTEDVKAVVESPLKNRPVDGTSEPEAVATLK